MKIVFKGPLIYYRGGGGGLVQGGEGHEILCNQKGECHQKFNLGFGEGHDFFVNIAAHLK